MKDDNLRVVATDPQTVRLFFENSETTIEVNAVALVALVTRAIRDYRFEKPKDVA